MSRIFGLLNALAWAAALAIAWTERRDPARPAAQPTEGAATGSTAPPASPVAPTVPTEAPSPGATATAENTPRSIGVNAGAEPSPSPSQAPAPPSPPSAPPPPTHPVSAVASEPPSTAAPISEEPVPDRPIVGTGAPITVRDDGPRVPAGAVAGDGTATCPPDHPIKGNADSLIYHRPGQASYDRTIPELCFASEEAATAAGYRAPRG